MDVIDIFSSLMPILLDVYQLYIMYIMNMAVQCNENVYSM